MELFQFLTQGVLSLGSSSRNGVVNRIKPRSHSYGLLPGWGRVIYTICGVPCSRAGTCPVVYHGARQGARPPPRELRRHTHTSN